MAFFVLCLLHSLVGTGPTPVLLWFKTQYPAFTIMNRSVEIPFKSISSVKCPVSLIVNLNGVNCEAVGSTFSLIDEPDTVQLSLRAEKCWSDNFGASPQWLTLTMLGMNPNIIRHHDSQSITGPIRWEHEECRVTINGSYFTKTTSLGFTRLTRQTSVSFSSILMDVSAVWSQMCQPLQTAACLFKNPHDTGLFQTSHWYLTNDNK